jgi:hypothetical protein
MQMREWIVKLVIASVLFVSMEGFADAMDESRFHQTHHAHADNGGNQWFPDSDGVDHSGDACEHFCHAHAVALADQLSFEGLPKFRTFMPMHTARPITCGAAPPTPPPNP